MVGGWKNYERVLFILENEYFIFCLCADVYFYAFKMWKFRRVKKKQNDNNNKDVSLKKSNNLEHKSDIIAVSGSVDLWASKNSVLKSKRNTFVGRQRLYLFDMRLNAGARAFFLCVFPDYVRILSWYAWMSHSACKFAEECEYRRGWGGGGYRIPAGI